MKITKYEKIIFVILLLLIFGGAWMIRYHVIYYFYLWQIEHTVIGGAIMDYTEKIVSIADKVEPLCVRTYKDVDESYYVRNAAAVALIKSNPQKAESLFLKLLRSEDDRIKSAVMLHLGMVNSREPYGVITSLMQDPSTEIRKGVAWYLGYFNDKESTVLLEQMRQNDPSEDVRRTASNSLFDASLR